MLPHFENVFGEDAYAKQQGDTAKQEADTVLAAIFVPIGYTMVGDEAGDGDENPVTQTSKSFKHNSLLFLRQDQS